MYACDVCKKHITRDGYYENYEFTMPIVCKNIIFSLYGDFVSVPDYGVHKRQVILCKECQQEIANHLCRMSIKE